MDGNHAQASAEVLGRLASLAGDVLVNVDTDGICRSATTTDVTIGADLTASFAADDATTIRALLTAVAAGPVLVRLRSARARWVSAVAVPEGTSGWWVQLREVHHPEMSPTDLPAGTADREQVLNEVAWLLSATPRTGKEIAIASCDLDGFAAVNEEHGREIGDEVMGIVTGRISDALRSGDLVARLEDDQLLIVLRGVHDLRGAVRVANKIRTSVEDPIALPVGELVQTVSVGVTLISRGESVDSVLERAEGAMMLAKESGRNAVMSSPPI